MKYSKLYELIKTLPIPPGQDPEILINNQPIETVTIKAPDVNGVDIKTLMALKPIWKVSKKLKRMDAIFLGSNVGGPHTTLDRDYYVDPYTTDDLKFIIVYGNNKDSRYVIRTNLKGTYTEHRGLPVTRVHLWDVERAFLRYQEWRKTFSHEHNKG